MEIHFPVPVSSRPARRGARGLRRELEAREVHPLGRAQVSQGEAALA